MDKYGVRLAVVVVQQEFHSDALMKKTNFIFPFKITVIRTKITVIRGD
jgi:hypothetical protein